MILTSNEHAYLGSSLTRAAVTIHHDAADCKWGICSYDLNYHNISLYTVVELGFQQTNYSISEQATLRDAMICVIINSGNLEREIAVNLTVTDATTEGKFNNNSSENNLILLPHSWSQPPQSRSVICMSVHQSY